MARDEPTLRIEPVSYCPPRVPVPVGWTQNTGVQEVNLAPMGSATGVDEDLFARPKQGLIGQPVGLMY